MSREVLALVVIGFFFWTVIRNPPSVQGPAGTAEIPTSNSLAGVRDKGAADAEITFTARDEKRSYLGRLLVRDGRVFEPDGTQEPRNQFDAERRRYRYLLDFPLDAGAWCGAYLADGENTSRIQFGGRFSPVRLLYGTTALDVVASEDVAGIGVSVYPITDRCGSFWEHTGLGAWYVVPFDRSDRPAWVIGISISTHH